MSGRRGTSFNKNVYMVGVTSIFVGLFEENSRKKMGGGVGGGEKKYAPSPIILQYINMKKIA